MLIVLGGLPGTGKTTIAKALAAKWSACYLRVDEIEHALRRAEPGVKIVPKGYVIAQAIAASNLRLGNNVVADSVNPVPESRQAWRDVAANAKSGLLEIELICSDLQEHRRRVETRIMDIKGLKPPSWESVQQHNYTRWTEDRLVLDSAILGLDELLARIEAMGVTKR